MAESMLLWLDENVGCFLLVRRNELRKSCSRHHFFIKDEEIFLTERQRDVFITESYFGNDAESK
jgi:hypothetical protein